MFCRVDLEKGRVLRSPSENPIGEGTLLPYEEVKGSDIIDHETQEWGYPTFEIFEDKVIGTVHPTNKPPLTAEEKRVKFKLLRDKEIAEPINGVQVGRVEDRENIQGAIDRFDTLATDGAIGWIMADNSIKMLTKLQLIDIADGYAIRKAQVFNNYGMLCLTLNEAETVEDIIAIGWTE